MFLDLRHAQHLFSSAPPSRPSLSRPAMSAAPQMREPAPAPAPQYQEVQRVQPASSRIPVRERSASNFPAFDTDWDVPAFQRKGQ